MTTGRLLVCWQLIMQVSSAIANNVLRLQLEFALNGRRKSRSFATLRMTILKETLAALSGKPVTFKGYLLASSALALCCSVLPTMAGAQQFSSKLYERMQWRMIGPFRGGRTVAVSGVPGQPNVFYLAAVNGGVWKSTDYGEVWKPIFEQQPTQSVGAIAVSPSNPNIIYVGSGEGLQRPDLSTGDGQPAERRAERHRARPDAAT